MTTLIGNKSEFAIETMIEPDLQAPSHVWGRMCVWAGNFAIGNINEEYCGLAQCVHHLNKVKDELDSLWSPSFESLSDNEIINLLYNDWFEPNFNDFGEPLKREQFDKYRFDCGFAEMFDGDFMTFLIKINNNELKLLYRGESEYDVKSFVFSKFAFLDAIVGFTDWFNKQTIFLKGEKA